ncbi:hypothetical protein [Nitrosophilus labii]|uniref:hypothetical protein n=1 Tax=Nitrosophilus labii TaxID=2706014 RepID=UPI00165700EB|nr:hypothetical protein [Nitrosophilus labii]
MRKKKVEVVLVTISTPIKIGIYEKSRLVDTIESNEKTSEYLPKIYKELSQKYDIKCIIFARGPGSFMSIKLVYIFLKTLQITKDLELKACDAFIFSRGLPIKAVGELYFVKENGKITVKKLDKKVKTEFYLPKNLKDIEFSEELEPLYILPAV